MSEPFGRKLLRAWPFAILAALAAVFVLMLTFSRKAPAIASLDPAMAAPGDQVVLVGDYFGRTKREGTLSLAGEIPPPSLIKSWSDQKIVFIVPEDATSGLVSVSNSQGTSTGVLFTNTESIPTVLQAASAPGTPLLLSIVPPQPQAGQTITLTGRGFGTGDRQSAVKLSAGTGGALFEILPVDCLQWSDRAVSFRWPAGAGATSSLQVSTSAGVTTAFPVAASSPVTLLDPRSLTVEIRLSAALAGALVLWGPVPQSLSGTTWTLDSAQPVPLSRTGPLVFRWPSGAVGDHRAVYRLNLTTWTHRWDGFPAGQASASSAPRGDDRPSDWWKSSLPALKLLTAKWGLETTDPWQKLQKIQTGLTAAFHLVPGGGPPRLVRTPAQILASDTLDSVEVSSLAGALASQFGIPVRLVSGLWLAPDGNPGSRVWNQVWVAGAGWIPWDPVDGGPGSLDNRHFAFETTFRFPVRLESKAQILASAASFGQGEPAGEAVWTTQEPVVQWEIKRTDK